MGDAVKLDFSTRAMDIGTPSFNLMRTLSVAATGGAEAGECLFVADRVKNGDAQSWVREWAALAAQLQQRAERAQHPVVARQAYLRASNYYRTAMFSLPPSDSRLDSYLTCSRTCFQRAAALFTPPIEVLAVPFGAAIVISQPNTDALTSPDAAQIDREQGGEKIGARSVRACCLIMQ